MRKLQTALPLLTALGLLSVLSPAPAKEPLANLELARQLNEAFVQVVEKVSPAVVVITVAQKSAASSLDAGEESPTDSMPDELWRYFRKQFDERRHEASTGQGSGIIIRPDGFILTNGHVVEDAESIEVRLQDGRTFKAKLRGNDPLSDVAVVQIEAKALPVAVLGDSSKVRVGEFAIAIGAPFGLDYSVTVGHISAKGRWKVVQGFEGAAMDQDFIQTDALMNPGNSGGPLVNLEGEVIGLNALIHGFHSGIGFAVPSNLAKEVSDQLIANGKFSRAWLGVEIHGVRDEPELRQSLKGVEDGVVVQRILPGGPAAKSELERNDVILAVEGKRVSTAQQLRAEIRGKPIGQPVTLDVLRDGKTAQIKVKPGEWVAPPVELAAQSRPSAETGLAALGLTIHTLTRELAAQFGVTMADGVLVMRVAQGTPAARKGIKPGDVITSVNHQPVTSPSEFREALKKADLKKGVALKLISGSQPRSEILKEGEE